MISPQNIRACEASTLAFFRYSTARELLASAFDRHSRLIFPGMAYLFRISDCDYRFRPTGAFAPEHQGGAPDPAVPESRGILHIRAVADFLLLRISIGEVHVETDSIARNPKQLSRWISIGVVLAAVALGLAVLYHANHSPRTDDAEVFANFIGIAPQVEGPIIR